MYKIILSLSLIFFLSCRTQYFADTEVKFERVSEAEVAEDTKALSLISPYRSGMEKEMNEVIGELALNLTYDRRTRESDLGNWVLDMMYDEIVRVYNKDIDFVIQNAGGIRVQSMSKGPILVGEMYEVMPFDNMVSVLTASGDQVQYLINHIVKDGGWPMSYTITYQVDGDEAKNIQIKGVPLETNRTYKVALPDYIANGGGDCSFLISYERSDININIRDLFINHIRYESSQGLLQSAALDQRVIIVDHE